MVKYKRVNMFRMRRRTDQDAEYVEEVRDTSKLDVDKILEDVLKLKNAREKHESKEENSLPSIKDFVDADQLCDLAYAASQVMTKEPSLLTISPPVNVCGDIHGQYKDLLEIFRMAGDPKMPMNKYLFLGDYIDRGNQGMECIVLLLCYKIKYPNRVYLLRGNHECPRINMTYGFFAECHQLYRNIQLFQSMNDMFDHMPLAAEVGNLLLLHGGISPELTNTQMIMDIERPLNVPEKGFICDLLWADPSDKIDKYSERNLNGRGTSISYGREAVEEFLEQNPKYKAIVRAHEEVPMGFESKWDGKLYTVFSAPLYPNYRGTNEGTFLYIKDRGGNFDVVEISTGTRYDPKDRE